MQIKPITEQDREIFNNLVNHPLQSYEWGEFREKTGVKVIRRGVFNNKKLVSAFQLTIHPVPYTSWHIGYLPKGEMPTVEVIEEIKKIGEDEKCIFIQLEPSVINDNSKVRIHNLKQNPKFSIKDSTRPLFTRYTFQLDLTKTEEELLKDMHSKTRYNIKVARKHGVAVAEENSKEAFDKYWELTTETTKRQGFYAHTRNYHKLQWDTFKHQLTNKESLKQQAEYNNLTSHLFTAKYNGKTLTTMLFFVFKDTLYYPYGASSQENRNVMHSTLTMWEAIRWGKNHGLKKFDMWGALGKNPNPKDSWIGFHTFKERFGPKHIEFIGSFDLIINPLFYRLYVAADKIRWLLLRVKKR